mgnify:CR=1 FL=1
MNWPVINTDSLEDEKLLVNFLKEKTAKELADMKFWPGDYGDFAGALSLAGWKVIYLEEYWFTAQKLSETQLIEYIEGDIYLRCCMQHTQLHAQLVKMHQ